MINKIQSFIFSKYSLVILVISTLFLVLLLQIHNTHLFDITRGFDDTGHNYYMIFLQSERRVPLANEGWELYQPPLYYLIASFLPTLYAVKWFGFSLWVLLTLATGVFVNKVFNSRILAGIGTILVSSLPVVLYMSPSISNEFASAVSVSITLIFYISIFLKKKTVRNVVILSLLMSISMLTKATAILLFICIIGDMLLNKTISQKLKVLGIFIAITTILAGWFYIRNAIIFQNPFIASIDFPQFAIHQPPGYRDITFFMNLKPFFTMDLYKAQFDSFLAGTYFSWYFDAHTVIVPVQEFSKAGIALILWTIPSILLFVKGYWQSVKHITSQNRLMIIYIPLLLILYALYNIKLPFYSTVKASFIMSAVIPWVYFILTAIKPYKKIYLLFCIYVFILVLLIVKNFWIMEWWYQIPL